MKKGFFRKSGTIASIAAGMAAAILLLNGCQRKPMVYRVGILCGMDFFAPITNGFKEKMAELGYVEGKNILYDVQRTNVDVAAYRNILKKFVADSVALILSYPTEASIEAKAITQSTRIPLVFVNVFTEGTNLIKSVRDPGGNLTGVRWPGPDMALQRLEIMREFVPKARQIWVPYFKDYPIVKSQMEAVHKACSAAGLTVTEVPATNAAELEAVLKKLDASTRKPPDVMLNIAEPLSIMPDAQVVMGKFAERHKIPVGGAYFLTEGYESVFGLLPQSIPQGKQAAFLADKILKGTPAGTLPVVSAECFFQISHRAAEKLGIKVSEGLLSKANEVIR
jgi:putative ABC transport system substrate-binding protein